MEKTFSSSISQTVFQREKVTTEVAEAHSGSNCIFTKSRLPIFLRTIKWSLDVERLLFLWPSQCRNSSTTILTTPYSCRRVRSILPGNFLAPHNINIAQRARKQAATKLPLQSYPVPIPLSPQPVGKILQNDDYISFETDGSCSEPGSGIPRNRLPLGKA